MSVEIWVLLVVVAAIVAAGLGYGIARRRAPSQRELDELKEALDQARNEADTVQASVSEHFEQSAVLFGKLAKDYREFLDHFSASARELGLSENRARELLEQGFQPLLTDESAIVPSAQGADSETADAVPASMAEPPSDEDVSRDPGEAAEEEPSAAPDRVAEVFLELPDTEPDAARGDITESDALDSEASEEAPARRRSGSS